MMRFCPLLAAAGNRLSSAMYPPPHEHLAARNTLLCLLITMDDIWRLEKKVRQKS